MLEKLKENKALKITGTVLYYMLVLLIVAVLAVVILQRVSKNNITIGGIRIFNIVSESMVPKYEIGDVLIAKSIDPKELKVGDDIAYQGEVGTFFGKVVTHQIIDIKEENGELKFTTKGIANEEADPEISSSQIYGKIVYHVKSLSLISKIINNIYGFYFLIFVPITILIIIKIRDIYVSIKERKEDDDEDEEEDENKKGKEEDSTKRDNTEGNDTKGSTTRGNNKKGESSKGNDSKGKE